MSRRPPSQEGEEDENERRMADHFVQFLDGYIDTHVSLEREDDIIDKLELSSECRNERLALEKATDHEGDGDPVVYGVEMNNFEIRADRFLLCGLGTFAGLRLGRHLWSRRLGSAATTPGGRRVAFFALEAALSLATGAYLALEAMSEEEFVVRSSIADVPLVAGRSMLSEELCEPLTLEYQRFPSAPDNPQLPQLETLPRFIDNCRRRQEHEAQLRQEQGLGPDEPVSIPLPGVPVNSDDDEVQLERGDSDTRNEPANTRGRGETNTPTTVDGKAIAAVPSKEGANSPVKKRPALDRKPNPQEANPSSFFHQFWDSYCWVCGKVFESIADFELKMTLNGVARKRSVADEGNTAKRQELKDLEVMGYLKHEYRAAIREILSPETLYPAEKMAVYGPLNTFSMARDGLLAGVSCYMLWRHGPRLMSFLLSIVTKRYRAAPMYADAAGYIWFGRALAVSVAELWYMAPLLQRQSENLPVIPLVEGRSRVCDNMCYNMIQRFQELEAKETCERVDSGDLQRIHSFVRNCERRRAYETVLRKEQGLEADAPVPIPHPGVPVDYAISGEPNGQDGGDSTDEDWAETLVADRSEDS